MITKETRYAQHLIWEKQPHFRAKRLHSDLECNENRDSLSQLPVVTVIIPAYNEERNIGGVLSETIAVMDNMFVPYEIIVVDDGSSDGTADIVRAVAADLDSIRLIDYMPNLGKGHAVRVGIRESAGELVGFTDADLSAPIEEMDKLLAAVGGGSDIAIGSRAVKGAMIPKHQPLYRELGGKALNLVIRALAVRGIHDTQCGFKLFKGDIARSIFSRCFLDGWGFDVEVLYLARKMGRGIAEIPVVWSHFEGSKIHPVSAGIGVVIDIIRMRIHRYPQPTR